MRYAIYLWLILASAFSAAAAPAQPTGVVTLVEGKASLTRGLNRYALAEGVRLEKGDIVELAEDSLVQLESGGAALAAGPRTRLLLSGVSKAGGVELFLLRGQLKATVRGVAHLLATPNLSATVANATVVLQVESLETALFAETGEIKAQEVNSKALTLKGGEFYLRKGDGKGEVAARPSSSFVTGLPRPFLDKLPSQLDKFKDRKVEPKKVGGFAYGDVEPWLKSPLAVRKPLVSRWRAKAKDPAFRKALVENLKDHPEWDPILFPEKYEEAAKAKEEAKAKERAAKASAGEAY